MADLESRLEVERVENLISNFGWKVVKQEIKEDEIVLKVSKPKASSVEESAKAAGAD